MIMRRARLLLVPAIVLAWSVTAFAQLDPLGFIKRVPPTVIVVVDTSLSMLTDGYCRMSDSNCTFYDPGFWSTQDTLVVTGMDPAAITGATYRRKYANFNYALTGSGNRYVTTGITAMAASLNPNSMTSVPSSDRTFLDPTRYAIAKQGIAAAVTGNQVGVRWGLITLRQKNPRWPTASLPGGQPYVGGSDCSTPVINNGATDSTGIQATLSDSTPCNAGGAAGHYGVYAADVDASNYSLSGSAPPSGINPVLVSPSSGNGSSVLTIVNRYPGDSGTSLIPAGQGDNSFEDRPLSFALVDAKTAVTSAMTADAASTRTCRNTVVVLITGGSDSGSSSYLASNNVTSIASQFASVTASSVTARVPIYVIGVKVANDATVKTQLQTIASNSGGVYHDATTANDVATYINYAVQAGYQRQSEFVVPSPSNYTPVSPIIGTVDLENAEDAAGAALPNTIVYRGGCSTSTGTVLPQRSNVLVTAGFELPGFYGRLRAFRVYKPACDATQSTGYKFVNDGTKLWPDIDSRPSLAGQARTPLAAVEGERNIFTYIPDGMGGGSIQPFTTGNVANLYAAMGFSSATQATSLISFVRSQPIGAIVGSTPAIMDPPSLDPPPDNDYGHPDTTGTFAGNHANRRSIIFVGANDGMLHAIDARTGFEVWAFIPPNLLPKLQVLYNGQPLDRFNYFVDSSPKLAEVKLDPTNTDPAKRWHSMLIFGEGPGGLFYQAFDVTEAGMGVDPTLDGTTAVSSLLTSFADTSSSGPIQFKWSFPNYNHFDPTILQTFALSDGTPGNAVTLYGDLTNAKGATYAEKTVGFTWSDPAVGPLIADRSVNGAIVGSGYFPAIETSTLLGRGGASAPAAGNVLYLIDVNTGQLVGNPTGAACSGTGCISVGDVSNGRKNALQADPTAAGLYSSPVVTKAYVGDIDGKYWRFDFTSTGSLTKTQMYDTGQPIYASSALLFVGSTDVYMFVATGSDSLPPTTTGGAGTSCGGNNNCFKLYGLKDGTTSGSAQFSINLAPITVSGNLITGERPSASPTVAGDIVFFTTTTESATAPCSDFNANLYAVTYQGSAAYDANNNGRIDTTESKIVKTVAGRASAPFIVDQHLYFSTAGATGAQVEAFGDPQDFNNGVGQVGVRILSWREIR